MAITKPKNKTGHPKIARGLGWLVLAEEAEAQGTVEISPTQDAEQLAFLFLREFEKSIGAIGRRDIDLFQTGIRESSALFGKVIPLRPAEGWEKGRLRYCSLAARARPGFGQLLFVLIATPGNGTISYELKMTFRFNPLFYYPVLPFDFVWNFVMGYLRLAEAHSNGQPYERYRWFTECEQDRTLQRMGAYLPLVTGALAKAIECIEVTSPIAFAAPARLSSASARQAVASQPPPQGKRPKVWD